MYKGLFKHYELNRSVTKKKVGSAWGSVQNIRTFIKEKLLLDENPLQTLIKTTDEKIKALDKQRQKDSGRAVPAIQFTEFMKESSGQLLLKPFMYLKKDENDKDENDKDKKDMTVWGDKNFTVIMNSKVEAKLSNTSKVKFYNYPQDTRLSTEYTKQDKMIFFKASLSDKKEKDFL